MGTTVRVASIRLDGHAFQENRTPSLPKHLSCDVRKQVKPTISVLHILEVRAVHDVWLVDLMSEVEGIQKCERWLG